MIFYIIHQVFTIYTFLIIGYILLSWVPAAQASPIGRFLATLCEPYLGFFRKFIPPIGMIDISPIVAIFALRFIQQGLMIVVSYIV
ncbi:YggT family protein [Solibacillus sp. CAU 1738]|uniref:YggT family protein n=1 Tax=Solibacillus sp. CAU 1738 TaxID=3140363 RepID=UPI00326017D7